MQHISYEQLKELREQSEDFTLIYVQSQDGFAAAHIPGSLHADHTHSLFVHQAEKLAGGKEHPVIVYSANLACNAPIMAAIQLDRAGFRHVYVYEGGVREWQERGRALPSRTVLSFPRRDAGKAFGFAAATATAAQHAGIARTK